MIKIIKNENKIVLKTKNTTYAMEMLYGKFPVHLYYGKTSPKADLTDTAQLRSFSPYYPEHGLTLGKTGHLAPLAKPIRNLWRCAPESASEQRKEYLLVALHNYLSNELYFSKAFSSTTRALLRSV